MNADRFFALGSTHTICQDYALVDGGQRAVYLSDGCSSAPATDFGSRFLTLAASRTPGMSNVGWEREVVGAAQWMSRSVGLPTGCLDATLLVAYLQDDAFHALAWGDGVIAARRRADQTIEHVLIESPKGAPDYPSYLLDEERRQVYLTETGGEKAVSTFLDGVSVDSVSVPCFTAVRRVFSRADYDLVAVLSDGARSFQRPEGTSLAPVPEIEILRHVMAVQSPTGAFVVRRVRNGFLTRHCVAEKWSHADDFAVAAIHWEAP